MLFEKRGEVKVLFFTLFLVTCCLAHGQSLAIESLYAIMIEGLSVDFKTLVIKSMIKVKGQVVFFSV